MNKFPEKSHSAKRDNRAEGMMDVSVQAGVAEGTHLPFVSLSMGDRKVRLSFAGGIDMAMTTYQAAIVAYNDAMLVSYFENVRGYDSLIAYQEMLTYQQYRAVVAKQQTEMQAAAKAGSEAAAEASEGV